MTIIIKSRLILKKQQFLFDSMKHFKESNFEDLQDSLEAKWIYRQHTAKKSQIFPTEISSKQAKDSQLSNTRQKVQRGSQNTISNSYDDKLNKIIKDFGVLRRCIKVYCREQSKNKNKKSFDQVLKMIEAFNRSEISSVSNQVSILVQKMIKTIKFAENVNQDSSISLDSSRYSNRQPFTYDHRKQQQYNFAEVKDVLLNEIQLLDRTLIELQDEKKKINQARNLAVKMTKYERWSQIGRLQQIISEQEKKIQQLNSNKSLL